MVRDEWLNLNGLWQFAPAPDTRVPFGEDLPERFLVPYPVESALSGIMRHEASMWYRREVTIPPEWKDRRVLLHFGAVDWQSTLYVNGQRVGNHQGGYDAFSFDITPFIQWNGTQQLLLYVADPTTADGQPRGKQSLVSRDIWYTATSGIWQTVWMKPVASTAVTSLEMIPDIDAQVLRLFVHTSTPDPRVTAEVVDSGKSVAKAEGDANAEIRIPIPNPHTLVAGKSILVRFEDDASEGQPDGGYRQQLFWDAENCGEYGGRRDAYSAQ
jgi:hypothetical protein